MATVKVVREHMNNYGSDVKKSVGDEYDIPDNLVKALSDAGLVKQVKSK